MFFERHRAAVEQQHRMQLRAAYAFVPIDVTHTEHEAAWLVSERLRKGLGRATNCCRSAGVRRDAPFEKRLAKAEAVQRSEPESDLRVRFWTSSEGLTDFADQKHWMEAETAAAPEQVPGWTLHGHSIQSAPGERSDIMH